MPSRSRGAARPLREALALFREVGDRFYTAFSLLWIAILSIGKPEGTSRPSHRQKRR